MMQMHPERCTDDSTTAHPNSHLQAMQFHEHSKLLPWLMLCALLSGTAMAFSVVACCSSWWQAKEAKQLQIQVMDQNALLIREGLKQPHDDIYGPASNLE